MTQSSIYVNSQSEHTRLGLYRHVRNHVIQFVNQGWPNARVAECEYNAGLAPQATLDKYHHLVTTVGADLVIVEANDFG